MYYFLFFLLISLSWFSFLFIGEKIAKVRPNSNFTKWWRANMIGDDIY